MRKSVINILLAFVLIVCMLLDFTTYSVFAAENDVVWKKNFGGGGFDRYNSVAAVADGVIAVGYSGSYSFEHGDWEKGLGKGRDDAIVIKYNDNGDVVWKKNFGGRYDDYYNSVTAVADGLIAVGCSDSIGDGDLDGLIGNGRTRGRGAGGL